VGHFTRGDRQRERLTKSRPKNPEKARSPNQKGVLKQGPGYRRKRNWAEGGFLVWRVYQVLAGTWGVARQATSAMHQKVALLEEKGTESVQPQDGGRRKPL